MWADWGADLSRVIIREMDGIEAHDATLSEAISRLFRSETAPGKAAFAVTLTAGSVWLWRHIATFQYSHKGK